VAVQPQATKKKRCWIATLKPIRATAKRDRVGRGLLCGTHFATTNVMMFLAAVSEVALRFVCTPTAPSRRRQSSKQQRPQGESHFNERKRVEPPQAEFHFL
jgi:hypothetical protein